MSTSDTRCTAEAIMLQKINKIHTLMIGGVRSDLKMSASRVNEYIQFYTKI